MMSWVCYVFLCSAHCNGWLVL
uniref:Uncharacterized protein n=1 Tax=Arundo donax TaxID=35708 RepID=A0A0A9F1M5_ARUDO